MKRIVSFALFGLMTAPLTAYSSGYLSPAHSQLTYSFTCPSGASGHITYVKDFSAQDSGEIVSRSSLKIWINGNYVHTEAAFAMARSARNIEQVQASCGIDSTLIVIETFDPSRSEAERLKTLIVPVDHTGKVMASDG